MADDHDEGYSGPATLTVDGRDIAVHVLLDARHEPQDGRLHWFGRLRVEAADPVDLGSVRTAELSTAGGQARPASLGDVDPWGRYRVTGVGLPPYPLEDPTLDG